MLADLAQQYDVIPNQSTTWRAQSLEGASEVFEKGTEKTSAPTVDVKALHAKIGERSAGLANDFLEGALGSER